MDERIISFLAEFNASNKDKDFYLEHRAFFKGISEYKYWCAHSTESDFLQHLFCPCGNKNNYLSLNKGYSTYCSVKCCGKFAQEKRKQTCLKKYGASNAMKLDHIKAKMNKTRLEKYGTTNLMSVPSIQKKAANTCLQKYGVKSFSQSKEFSAKLKQHCMEIYGIEHPSQIHINHIEDLNEEYVRSHFIVNHKFKMQNFMEYFNLSAHAMFAYKEKFHILEDNDIKTCKTQTEIYDFISSFGIPLTFNEKNILKPKELDIYSLTKNIAIEYDGIMYHSFGQSSNPIFNNFLLEHENKLYHLRKTLSCEEKGIHLFHIFENEWLNPIKQEIWKSMLLNAFGLSERIYARKCVIKETSSKEARTFLEENHLQGFAQSSINLGLYYQDELVSIMTFGKPRFNRKYDYELIRFCNKKNTSVIGGASKLFKHFIKEYSPTSIVSYANRRWSRGNLYEKLGFKLIDQTKPNYFYFTDSQKILYSRIQFQKHKLSKILPNFNPNLTESENMYNNGYRKIYDCGNRVYVFFS